LYQKTFLGLEYKNFLITIKKTKAHMKKTWILGLTLIALAVVTGCSNSTESTDAIATDSTATDQVVIDSAAIAVDELAADTAN
jgi:uncharacterized lipoprotein YajG